MSRISVSGLQCACVMCGASVYMENEQYIKSRIIHSIINIFCCWFVCVCGQLACVRRRLSQVHEVIVP